MLHLSIFPWVRPSTHPKNNFIEFPLIAILLCIHLNWNSASCLLSQFKFKNWITISYNLCRKENVHLLTKSVCLTFFCGTQNNIFWKSMWSNQHWNTMDFTLIKHWAIFQNTSFVYLFVPCKYLCWCFRGPELKMAFKNTKTQSYKQNVRTASKWFGKQAQETRRDLAHWQILQQAEVTLAM